MSSSPPRLQSSPDKISSPCASTPSSAQQQPTAWNRPLAELVGAPFSPFDPDTVAIPFQEEDSRDATFQRELTEMLLDATLQSHAWASARTFHETQTATQIYEQQIIGIQNTESEQEKARLRLDEFLTSMKSALAALTAVF